MVTKCGKCNSPVSYSYSGNESFCINPNCANFMLDLYSGEKVNDERYKATALSNDNPEKIVLIKKLLDSSDYMEQIAGIRTLEFMPSQYGAELLSGYVKAGRLSESVIYLALEKFLNWGDIKGLSGLKAGLEQMENMDRQFQIPGLMNAARQRINELSYSSKTLIEAVKRNDINEIKEMIKKGVDLNELGPGNSSPLHWAVFFDRSEAIKILVASGAEINFKDVNGKTPLLIAREFGKKEIESLLLKLSEDKSQI